MRLHSILCMALITALLTFPAWAGCGKWVIRDNTDYLSDPDFDQAVASSTGAAATLNPDGTAKGSGEKDLADEVEQSEKLDEKAIQIDLGGEWRVLLDNKLENNTVGPDGQDKQLALDLILIQTKERLQGYGTLREGGADLPATANGYISEDSLSLIVLLVEQKKEYKLDLTASNEEMKGIYELYESEKLAGKGNATASRLSS